MLMTSDQKQEESLKLFFKRFDCAFNQTKKLGFIPTNNINYWNLICNNRIMKLKNIVRGDYLNPISIMLNGTKINQKIFGLRNDYAAYLTNNYPFYNIEESLFLKRELL